MANTFTWLGRAVRVVFPCSVAMGRLTFAEAGVLTDAGLSNYAKDVTTSPDGQNVYVTNPDGIGNPCWTAQWKYQNRFLNPDGIRLIKLRAGPEGKASVKVKGRGSNLGLPDLPLVLPVTAQLQASNGECWNAEYSTFVSKNVAAQFLARSD
jgi:hypothetical protein